MQKPNRPTRRLGGVLAVTAALAASCSGKIGENGTDLSKVHTPQGPAMVGPVTCAAAGTNARVRRFTRSEYDKSVSDLLGEELNPSKDFPLDSAFEGYTNQADALLVTPLLAEALAASAETLATKVVGKLEPWPPARPPAMTPAPRLSSRTSASAPTVARWSPKRATSSSASIRRARMAGTSRREST